jgi:hypothetical protein
VTVFFCEWDMLSLWHILYRTSSKPFCN